MLETPLALISPTMELVVFFIGFYGHAGLSVWCFNRLHAIPWPRPRIKFCERVIMLLAVVVPLLFASRWLSSGPGAWLPYDATRAAWLCYPIVCWCAAAATIPLWVVPKLGDGPCPALISNDTIHLDVCLRLGFAPVGDALTAFCARAPGNEILRLAIQRKTLRLPRLPPRLAGLKIAHLSDLHMTGQLTREFYELMVEQANLLQPDIVVLTGDIAEKLPCLSWIEPILGQVTARYGKYFVFGNHEKRLPDPQVLRDHLRRAGWVDAASRYLRCPVAADEILIAGTELPWFGAAPDLLGAPELPFRLLLSHSPDQLPWAKQNGFDLMVAGHNHGGQIRLPLIGPLIAPSKYGFRYAGGLYWEPPTLLHVSRGLAGIHPVRFNCPPEIALLILQPAH